jgi:hypothetical protein
MWLTPTIRQKNGMAMARIVAMQHDEQFECSHLIFLLWLLWLLASFAPIIDAKNAMEW